MSEEIDLLLKAHADLAKAAGIQLYKPHQQVRRTLAEIKAWWCTQLALRNIPLIRPDYRRLS